MSNQGWAIRARARASICCSPPTGCRPIVCAVRQAGAEDQRSLPVSFSRARAAGRYAPISRFSSIVMRGNNFLPSGTCTIPCPHISPGASPRIGFPFQVISPSSAGARPDMAFNKVVFPEPFEPMRATSSPSSISRETPCSAEAPGMIPPDL